MNIFEQASRKNLRFTSSRGELLTEQLWTMPLTSKSGFDLDTVARGINQELKAVTGDSFVSTYTNPTKTTLELQLEIVKYIIAVKLQEAEDNSLRIQRADERAKLIDIVAAKRDESLKALPIEELEKKLAALAQG